MSTASPVSALTGIQGPGPIKPATSPAAKSADGSSFGDILKQFVTETSNLQDRSADAIGAYVRGEPVELHQVMSAVEEANLSLEMLAELRNKLLEAYRSVAAIQ